MMLPYVSGIYIIRNLVTGKIYVGSAVMMGKRVYEHRRLLMLRLIPLSQVHRLMTDRPSLRCAHRPDEIRWLSCDGVTVA